VVALSPQTRALSSNGAKMLPKPALKRSVAALTSSPSLSLRFGPGGRFELQAAERRLFIGGRQASIGSRALDLLVVLAAQPDQLLSKSELLDRVWPGLVVEEANLQMQISNLRKLLGSNAIATVPGRGYRFVAAVQPTATVQPATAAPGQRLFGRGADLARLHALLQQPGCVTLVGTAGVGKTSLARAAAAGWPGRHVWVDLAALAEGPQVAPMLARALGAPLDSGAAAPQLLQALQGQTLLLVLDNAEHLVQTCAELATLLRPLAGLHLLVTSQLPLAVAGERVQRLAPLALAGGAGAAAGGAANSAADGGALELLLERIAAADHRLGADAAALPLPLLAAVCTQLDGLPLALEMAAARVPLLGLQGVHDALAERFALLTRGHRDAAQRHRTLHAALDWSYRLLDAPEQRLLRALGVFVGGFTLELAAALMGDDSASRWDVIDGLAALADRSLLVVGLGDPPRYRLLESVRAFALEQLHVRAAAGDDEAAVRRRHATVVLALFVRCESGPAAAQAQGEAEMDNARAALAWAREHALGIAAELTTVVAMVSSFSVWRQESTDWLLALEPLMETPAGQALPAPVQAAWWTGLARMLSIRRDRRAAVVARRALALWVTLDEPRRTLLANVVWVRAVGAAGPELDEACRALQARAEALPDLSVRERLQVHGALVLAATEREDLDAILSGRLTEMALAQELGLQQMVDAAESNVVFALNAMNRHAEAAERGRHLLARVDAGSVSTQGNLPWVLQALLKALVMQGELDEAQALAPRAWSACARFDTPVVVPTLVQLAALQGRLRAAASLSGYARARFEARASALGDVDEQALAQAEALAAAALGAATAQALVHHGRMLANADAAALVLGEVDSPAAAAALPRQPG
jgi:predicted ATPase/DNA-binding winged helix-turn-helix (wHTH) protein